MICQPRLFSIAFVAALTALAGCAESGGPAASDENQKAPAVGEAEHAASPEVAGQGHAHQHESWWCEEHGVPEEICGRCNAKRAAEFQRNGDWCKEHDRPESQCFICHPEYEENFAAQYEAKVGSKPPKPQG